MDNENLVNDSKYRKFADSIDKALRQFEYSSDWTDLISHLGKIGKIISSSPFSSIPRSIKISKRLSQCLHSSLPSGVHLKTLETYELIFIKVGMHSSSDDILIYSSGLFPLLSFATMNVKSQLLNIYEQYFVPLGVELRPALSGFLNGVLPAYDSNLDFFEQTKLLLHNISKAVHHNFFMCQLWDCMIFNSAIRLNALQFIIDHYSMFTHEVLQQTAMKESLLKAISYSLEDNAILVQRNALEFLMLCLPIHCDKLSERDRVKLLKSALITFLRRDMSLNRRVFSWILGCDINKIPNLKDRVMSSSLNYLEVNSKKVLILSLVNLLQKSLINLDLSYFKIVITIIDKSDVGQNIIDFIMIDILRTLYLHQNSKSAEVSKIANQVFSIMGSEYMWNFLKQIFKESSSSVINENSELITFQSIGSGTPNLHEFFDIMKFVLDIFAYDMHWNSNIAHLPKLLLTVMEALSETNFIHETKKTYICLQLSLKLISRINRKCDEIGATQRKKLEKSKSDSKIDKMLDVDCPIRKILSNHNLSTKQKQTDSYNDLEKDINDIYYMFEENIISSLYHYKAYLKHLLYIYMFGGNYEDACNFDMVEKIFNSFNNNARNKVLKNLLNNSIKNDVKGSFGTDLDKSELRIENSNTNLPDQEIMTLSFRTLIEISILPLTKDFKQPQCKDFPLWAKHFVIFCVFMDKDTQLQITSISVLIDILCILRMHNQDNPQLLSYSSDLFPILLFVEDNPNIFRGITSILWKYLGEPEIDATRIVSLLYQLHNLLDESLVEEVIGNEISKHKNFVFYKQQNSLDCDISYKQNYHYIEIFKKFELLWNHEEKRQKGFASILMIFLDILTFPNNEPFKNIMLKWLHNTIVKGYIERIMYPFMNILLSSETSRVTIADYSKVSEIVKNEADNKQYLKKNNMILTEHGNSLLNGDDNNGYNMIELFINPFQETDNNQIQDFLTNIIEQVIVESENDESIDEDLLNINLPDNNPHKKTLLNDWCNNNEKYQHVLLYNNIFDYKKVAYSLKMLGHIIDCDPRTFLFAAISSSITNPTIKDYWVFHKKSILGKSRNNIKTEYTQNVRNVKYLEVLIITCLYYIRSFYYKHSNKTKSPTIAERLGNTTVQLSSIEIMRIICERLNELVCEMGRDLSNYILDLMVKTKISKIILHCLSISILCCNNTKKGIYSNNIYLNNNFHAGYLYDEAVHVNLLRLLKVVVKLEYEVIVKGSDAEGSSMDINTENISKQYNQHITITQQPIFLITMLKALKCMKLKHLHQYWFEILSTILPCLLSTSLTNIIVSVTNQICKNLMFYMDNKLIGEIPYNIDAIILFCHYCLIDNRQIISKLFNQAPAQITVQNTNSSGLLNNLVNSLLLPFSLNNSMNPIENDKVSNQINTRKIILNHLPNVINCFSKVWDVDSENKKQIQHKILDFINPIFIHYGNNLIQAFILTWHQRKTDLQSLFEFSTEQESLVDLILSIRVIQFNSLIDILSNVIRTTSIPSILERLEYDNSCLELLICYIQRAQPELLKDSWNSFSVLMKDTSNSNPLTNMLMYSLLNEYVEKCPDIPFQDKKDVREIQDITQRFIDQMIAIASGGLQSSNWLRKGYIVKESNEANVANNSCNLVSQQMLSKSLSNLIDVIFGAGEKSVTITANVINVLIPYLKNKNPSNFKSYSACSKLLENISQYQYTRKAWKKDIFEIFLDSSFSIVNSESFLSWKFILDNLMTYDNITFRELLAVQISNPSERSLLIRKLAFVIFCSEDGYYDKYLVEIQEQLTTHLKYSSNSLVESALLFCFRVLLMKLSAQSMMSLWPIVIAELVQVFLSIEENLDIKEKYEIKAYLTNIKVYILGKMMLIQI
ncbi:DOPEY1 family protein [Megaselia abdita]